MASRAFLGTFGIAPHVEGSSGLPVPGWDLQVTDNADIVVKLPLPPGASTELLGKSNGFHDKYLTDHKGFYNTGDAGALENGHLVVHGRTDDVINVSGHRLTTGQLEEAVAVSPGVVETAVVGVADPIKGTVPVAFVVGDFIDADIVQSVRWSVGAVANLKVIYRLGRLPKTRSGKLMRSLLRDAAERRPLSVPPTIEDASVLEELERVVREHHHHHRKH